MAGTGESILVGSRGRIHTVGQGQSPEAIKALPHLPELIKKAFKTGEYNPKPSTAKKRDTRPTTTYHAVAVIDDTSYDMQLVAKRNAVGEQELVFYDLRARSKNVKMEPARTSRFEPHQQADSNTHGYADNIHPDTAVVNSDLSATQVSDFFSDVKDIVDDI